MSVPKRDSPPSCKSLQARIRNVAKAQGQLARRLELVIAHTIVGQVLPPGAVKGGAAIKLRVGDSVSRFTRDLDTTRSAAVPIDDYIEILAAGLANGWQGFTGTVRTLEAARPEGVPSEYVMRPFSVHLAYRGSAWVKLPLEVGHDEIDGLAQVEERVASDILDLFAAVGLPEPRPVPLLSLDHQIAQKLHACTSRDAKGGNERAHDLVDLQILEREGGLDLSTVGATARRLFAARRAQAWPPTVVAFPGWEAIYAEAADGLDVIGDVDGAVTWANDLITRIG